MASNRVLPRFTRFCDRSPPRCSAPRYYIRGIPCGGIHRARQHAKYLKVFTIEFPPAHGPNVRRMNVVTTVGDIHPQCGTPHHVARWETRECAFDFWIRLQGRFPDRAWGGGVSSSSVVSLVRFSSSTAAFFWSASSASCCFCSSAVCIALSSWGRLSASSRFARSLCNRASSSVGLARRSLSFDDRRPLLLGPGVAISLFTLVGESGRGGGCPLVRSMGSFLDTRPSLFEGVRKAGGWGVKAGEFFGRSV